jgi:hypothetical protein
LAIKLDYVAANSLMASAVELAKRRKGLPVEWVSHSNTVFGLDSKTYTPALATLLLAKALNSNVDTMSIKVTGDSRSYSLRGLGHTVVVPAAVTFGFAIRATGREPLNNQPWFRYNRIDEFERVRVRRDYEYFLDVARRANSLSSADALAALAGFLSVAFDQAARTKAITIKSTALTAEGARIAAEDFLRADASDRPRRLQAFAAACLDLGHVDVRSRRINDPSRDVPGDVQVYANEEAVLSMEVRGKSVPNTELDAFADACATAGIARAMLFVDQTNHRAIDLEALESHSVRRGVVQVSIFESAADLVSSAIAWADLPMSAATERFALRMLERLREIEVAKSTLDEWVRAVTVVQAR